MKPAADKKQQIIDALEKIEEQSKYLTIALEKVYKTQKIEDEREFVSSCNYLQMLAKQALSITGYYKRLSDFPRDVYAPEELEGDEADLTKLVSFEFTKIEKQIEEGNKTNPINIPDITKERWLKDMESHKVQYKKTFEESKKYYETDPDSQFCITPVETNIFLDEEIINAAEGFMVGPVGMFRNKGVEAGSQVFDNLTEMKIFLLNVQCKTMDMVLYMTYELAGQNIFRVKFVNKP